MFKRKNKVRTYMYGYWDYYFFNPERIFMYYEMTLMNQH